MNVANFSLSLYDVRNHLHIISDLTSGMSLLTLFVIIGAIGFVFLIASLVLGDLFEMFGGHADISADATDFGLFDSRVIAVFITAFGGFGAIGVQTGFGAAVSSIIGLLGGVVFGFVVSSFGRFLVGQQASTTVTDETLVGRMAQVTVAIKPGEIGQITCRVGDERVEKIARAVGENEIKAGALVTVASIAGDSVIVEVAKGE